MRSKKTYKIGIYLGIVFFPMFLVSSYLSYFLIELRSVALIGSGNENYLIYLSNMFFLLLGVVLPIYCYIQLRRT